MNGTLNKVDFNYSVEDVITRYKDGNNADVSGVVLVCRAFENGGFGTEVKYLLMNADGSIQADLTANVKGSGLEVSTLKQIDDNLYLVGNNSTYALVDGSLNKVASLDMNIVTVDLNSKVIIGYISENGRTYYGSVDYNGKVVTEFVYNSINVGLNGSESYRLSTIYRDSGSEEYLVNFSKGTAVKLGRQEGKDDLKTYTAMLGNRMYYKNTIKSVAIDTETAYYVEEIAYDLAGNAIFTAISEDFTSVADAESVLTDAMVEEYVGCGQNIIYKVTSLGEAQSVTFYRYSQIRL